MTQIGSDAGDLEKLQRAFQELSKHFASLDDFLAAFGLAELPTAQRYGILFGCLTFFCTVGTVVALLIVGGSFKRIVEQSQTGHPTVAHAYAERASRALLLERLLEARARLQKKYPQEKRVEGATELTKMLLNEAPTKIVDSSDMPDLVDDSKKQNGAEATPKPKQHFPDGYLENYKVGYRRCQDKPGGPVLSGRPEARFEAFARAYAGCGNETKLNYRRSYARLYESIACATCGSDDKFSKLFVERPFDIIGRTVRLEALETERHLQTVYDLTSGDVHVENKSFDPNEVWGFLDAGPFSNPEQLRQSYVFQHKMNEAGFAMIQNLTDRVIGVVLLINDDPKNLTIQLEPPIVNPTADGSMEQSEACFLLMDRLFAMGYRRIELAVDSLDTKGRNLAMRLGFTQEGMLPKHMIVKEASRDSNVYGMLNSDWDKGARSALFKKLHGSKAQKVDDNFNRKDEELDDQERKLAEMKANEAAAKDKNA